MKFWGPGHCEWCQHTLERLVPCPFMSCMLLLLAGLMTLHLLVRLGGCLYRTVKRVFGGKDLRSYGEWAVVTGASDGIGKGLASELAKRGITKLLLVARNDAKLKDVETQLELQTSSRVEVRRLLVDFATESSSALFSKISEATEKMDVGILINNVGISYPHALYYDEVPIAMLDEILNVNVRSTLIVTRAILPGMKARKRGLIMCIGSAASEIPSDPLYAAYAATKASPEAFCRALKVECAPFGVDVQCQVPLLVKTKLSKLKTPSLTKPTIETFASYAVSAMEQASSSSSTVCPYWPHALQLFVAKHVMPTRMWDSYRFNETLGIRERALKKQGEQKKEK